MFDILGEMAPAYFDRMVNPMLSLMLHTKDDLLRASVLSSLSNLIISCRGLNIHKHLNEVCESRNFEAKSLSQIFLCLSLIDCSVICCGAFNYFKFLCLFFLFHFKSIKIFSIICLKVLSDVISS